MERVKCNKCNFYSLQMAEFKRNEPYNTLPVLPPDLETTIVLRKTIEASRALAKLNGMLINLPNPTCSWTLSIYKKQKQVQK